MIPLDKFKKILGEQALIMSDKDIEKLRDIQYKLADICFDIWNEKEKGDNSDFINNKEEDEFI